MTNAPALLSDLQADLQRVLDWLDDHADEYRKRKSFYDGTRAEVSTSPVIRKLIAAGQIQSPIALAHIPVDALMDKVELVSITSKDSSAKNVLSALWDANDVEDESDDWATKAAYFGDYYVISDPADMLDENGTASTATIIGSSPVTTVMLYEPRDSRTPDFAGKVWKHKKVWCASLFYDDVTVSLVTLAATESNGSKAEDFVFDLDDEGNEGSERQAHPGGKPLVTHIPIDGKPYGKPVHGKAFGPQDALTKVSAVNLANVDGQGFAARWAIADPMAEIDDDIDDDFGTAGPDTQAGDWSEDGLQSPTTGLSSQRVRTMPGAISLLRGINSVGQFAATGSDDFLKNMDWYVRIMAVATGTPIFEFDMNGSAISGEARRRAEGRITKHARKVIRALSVAYANLADLNLALLGVTADVEVTFRPVENQTDSDGLDLISKKIATGVPIAQAFLEAGYTVEQTDKWFPEGQPNIDPTTLTVLAKALFDLGNAKTLGVISDVELADMLPTILTGARNEGDGLLEVGPRFGPGGGTTGQGGATPPPGEIPAGTVFTPPVPAAAAVVPPVVPAAAKPPVVVPPK
ncbi:MAG: hypothetical protein JWO98_5322 [Frankiales bacterium]|nr:hypothetical protein [Frankiales bacterium]